MLLYSLLHLSGYELSLDDLRAFRQWGSRTPGHPERGLPPGVEVTTGPLGQGIANAVGFAMAERYLAARFNRPGHEIVDHRVYVIAGDGDLMEGISHEAASLAGHLRLGKLIVLFDDNRITIEGPTSLATSDDTAARFAALGWRAASVDGDDLDGIESALDEARRQADRPSLIAVRTHIGHGSPGRQDSARAHGEPLGEDELRRTKEALGWPHETPFEIPEKARARFAECVERGRRLEQTWRGRLAAYAREFPEEKRLWDRWSAGELTEGWREALAGLTPPTEPTATRVVSGEAINALAARLGNLVGGSADLGPSNNTLIRGGGAFQPGEVGGPNVHFGVREHAMGAAVNGMALHGGLRPYCGTFLVFSDYLRPAVRLAAMMRLPVIYVFTHDSIGLGEDGPTHQPVEQLPALRAIPDLTVVRPADAQETIEAWEIALERRGPTALILTRQKVPALSRDRLRMPAAADRAPCGYGAYVISEASVGDPDRPELILLASGSEVALCREAQAQLERRRISVRLVSMPSWELFEEQPAAYRQFVLPEATGARLAVEAAIGLGWERYTGQTDTVIGMTGFGASAPAAELFERFGLTAERIVARAQELLGTRIALDSGG
jgi:transketolase